MFTKRILLTIGLLSASSAIQAASWVDINLFAGPAFSKISNHAAVTVNPGVTNEYYTKRREVVVPILGLGLSHTFEQLFCKPINLAVGLSFYHQKYNTIYGQEIPAAVAGIVDPLSYHYNAKSYTLLVESKVFYTQYRWQPFLLLGLGNAWNMMYDYHEFPTIYDATIPDLHKFSDHKRAAFAYEVGAGVQMQLYNDTTNQVKYFASVDYRYMDNRKGNLGRFTGMHSHDRLHVERLSSQELMFTLTAQV